MRVAVIIRDLTQFGGGEKDVITLIHGLNTKNIVPDVFSENHPSLNTIKTFFNKSIQYNRKILPRPQNPIGRVLHEIFLPHPLSGELKKYDTIYDFTNKPPVYQSHKNYVKYVYIIEDARVLKASFLRNAQYKLYRALEKAGINKFRKVSPHIHSVTQSQFTQQEIKEKSGISLPIIYPPVNINSWKSEQKQEKVVSIGRFSPEKNQHTTLAIAKKCPSLPFVLIGKIDHQKYFNKLKKLINEQNITNVTIKTNLSHKELIKEVSTAQYFISTTIEEHFGISVVEAIAAGCIPIAHNSGGPKEIITHDNLLFNSESEAVNIIQNLQKKENKEKTALVAQLRKNISQFDEEHFTKKMLEYLN